MLNFLKNIFSTVIGILLSFLIIILIIAGVASLSSQKSTSTKKLDEKHFLKIDLSKEVVERTSTNPFSSLDPMNIDASQQLSLKIILDNIEKAKTDENIVGIYINSPIVNAGMSKAEEIRNKLLEFKETKKPIVAYNEVYAMKSYYLSSVADRLYINPMGIIDHKGMSATVMFFKGLLEKLNIDLQIFRLGKFKSAIEPFTLEKMSDSNRKQLKLLLKSVNNNIIDSIASQRGISNIKIHKDANQLKLSSAEICLEENYVDGILYEDQVKDTLKMLLGKDKLKIISINKYSNVKTKKKEISRNKIAIVYANGGINSGKGDENSIGSITTSKAIEKARKDEKVKAIVLRINSGGGSALASDVIWRETVLAKNEKPLVVSFGDVAASGGYYIACAADKIFASPTSITGSIGVFGMIPNMNEFYKSNFGITFDTVKTNNSADMGIYRKLTSFEKQKIQQGIEDVYETFISRVSEGRDISTKQVDNIGQGRVWSGYDAKKIGLIDEFGGLEKAIESAAALAEIEDYRTISLPKQKDPFTEFLDGLNQTKLSDILSDELDLINKKDITTIKEMIKSEKIQTRLPYILSLE
tara:strand:- start:1233 stop:2987 length:1755 start_codon:yes stop_codon:yes gene_type:complete